MPRNSKPTTNGAASTNFSPAAVSGVPRMLPYMVSGFGLLTACYATLFCLYNEAGVTFLPPPAQELCTTTASTTGTERCTRADLFAFQMTSVIPIFLCGGMGVKSWHINKHRRRAQQHTVVPQTAAGRLFGYNPEAEFLAAVNFTFQFWDFFVSLIIPEHRTAIMLTHHVAASTVSFCAVRYGVLHHYGLFFLGLSEVSSVFLVFVDLAKYFPPVPGTLYEHLVMSLAAPGFVLSFIVYRFLYWWPVSYQLFMDVYAVTVKTDQAYRLRPGKAWVLYIYLVLNLPLGLLQVYWLTVIAEEVHKVLNG